MNELRYFNIFGERCSGTNYLASVLKSCGLNMTWAFGFKHWFIPHLSHNRPNRIFPTDKDRNYLKLDDKKAQETLFVVLARNPHQWIASLYNKPHHIATRYKNRYEFITNKYSSSAPPNYPLIEEAENIIEMRNQKHNHWSELKNRVKHFYIIRYDNLLEDVKQLPFSVDVSTFNLKNNYKLDEKEKDFIDSNLSNIIDDMF